MEYLLRRAREIVSPKEKVLPLDMTIEAKLHLKRLLSRPNPFLSEFIFYALGKNGVIDAIVANELPMYPGSGLHQDGPHSYISSARDDDAEALNKKLVATGRFEDMIVYGHTHPTGDFIFKGQRLTVAPSHSHLNPSSGPRLSGGITSAHDMKAARLLAENWRISNTPPHFGIAALTEDGYKMRVFNTQDLAKAKRYQDIDDAQQITIDL